ncbi:hypothetical protein BDI4_190023 [Burkholderia diffusa]|nr:hypothetical protein BDI4_190023 [Burkholderia diffusa]
MLLSIQGKWKKEAAARDGRRASMHRREAVALGQQVENPARIGDEAHRAERLRIVRCRLRAAEHEHRQALMRVVERVDHRVPRPFETDAAHVDTVGPIGRAREQPFDRQPMRTDEVSPRILRIGKTRFQQKQHIPTHFTRLPCSRFGRHARTLHAWRPAQAGSRPDARLYRLASCGPTNILRNRYAGAHTASAVRLTVPRCVNTSSARRTSARHRTISSIDMGASARCGRPAFAIDTNAFAAASEPDAIVARAPGGHRRALQSVRAANCKVRNECSPTTPKSIAS